MTAGTELLRRKADKTGHVMTVPLITDATGKNLVSQKVMLSGLNPDKTSPYEMYQFWMNVMDADAIRFLKIFTFLSLDEIEEIRQQFEAAPHERLAQKVPAREVVSLVHGQEATRKPSTSLSSSLLEILKTYLSRNSNKVCAACLTIRSR